MDRVASGRGLPCGLGEHGKEPAGESGEGVQMGRVNWVNEVADKYLDMEKTFDDLFQRFTDESHFRWAAALPRARYTHLSASRTTLPAF